MGKKKSFIKRGFYEYKYSHGKKGGNNCSIMFSLKNNSIKKDINIMHNINGEKLSRVDLNNIIYFTENGIWVNFIELSMDEIIKIIDELSLGKRTMKVSYHKKGPYCKGGPPYYKDTNKLSMISISELMDNNLSSLSDSNSLEDVIFDWL